MVRPLSSEPHRNGSGSKSGFGPPRYGHDAPPSPEVLAQLDNLRSENDQLRQLCAELEQALQEATSGAPDAAAYEERMREYDALLEQKDDSIRQLHQQLKDAQAALDEAGDRPAAAERRTGPIPA